MAVNYVKFMRGSQALYDSLVTKNQDTLYFVYNNVGDDHGKLYLGNKLISGSSSNIDGTISLSDVEDIVLDANLSDGDILIYDEAEGKWVNSTLANALSVAVMTGATAETAGTSGLVPVPNAGDQNKYLRGDGTWVTVIAELSQQQLQDISDLQATVATLVDTDTGKSVATIAAEKVAELLIPQNAQESLDTLQEIADWIQSHPSDVSEINSSISNLQATVGDLDELLNGTTGHPENGLAARVGALETTMGTFVPVQGKFNDVGSAITYLNTTIDERLTWHELSED